MPRRGGAWPTAVLLIVLAVASLAASPGSSGETTVPDPTAIVPCPGITASSPQTLSTTPSPVPLNPCPGVVMGTLFGGSATDWAFDVAVDAAGNSYVTGTTNSTDFPSRLGESDPTLRGNFNAFVAKFEPSGALVYSTLLGGSSDEEGRSIALDSGGNAYVTGWTKSDDFPTSLGSFDKTCEGGRNGCEDAFVAKLDPAGAIVYSTLLGGADSEEGWGIAADASGNAYVTGITRWYDESSLNFPLTHGVFVSAGGWIDVFVTKLNPQGSELIYSTVIGGDRNELYPSLAVDEIGNAYVVGMTDSPSYPGTPDAIRPDGDFMDAFVFKLNPLATALVYSTRLGGSNSPEWASSVAVDSSGDAFITGITISPDFPTTSDAFDPTLNDCEDPGCLAYDAFLTKFDASGGLVYSTFFGGSGQEIGDAVYVDESGVAYLTGYTRSGFRANDFPTSLGAFDSTYNGFSDAFVAKLDPSGSSPLYSTFLGGGDEVFLSTGTGGPFCWGDCRDRGYSLAVDPTGNATVVGATSSFDFPTTEGAYHTTYNGGAADAFVIRIELIPEPNRAPVAYFEVVSQGENDSRVFVNASNSADAEDRDDLLEVRWDWEDDGIWDTDWSTDKEASHEYAAPGAYIIRLEVRDIGGLTSSVVREVTVVGPPVPLSVQALAAPTSGIVPLTVSFTSTVAGGLGPYAYVWTFGDGASSESPDPIHTFEIPGTYTVTLTVRDAQGRSISESIQVVVTGPAVETSDAGIPSWAAYVVAAAIAVSVVGVLLSRRRSRKAGPPR